MFAQKQDKEPFGLQNVLTSSLLVGLVRWALALLFFSAGCLKLSDPAVFAVTIDAFGIVSPTISRMLSYILPILEITAAVGLVLGHKWAEELMAALLGIFIVVILHAINMGLDIDCGCYGPAEPEAKAFSSLWTSLYRDLAMAVALAYLFVVRRFADRCFAFSNPHSRSLS